MLDPPELLLSLVEPRLRLLERLLLVDRGGRAVLARDGHLLAVEGALGAGDLLASAAVLVLPVNLLVALEPDLHPVDLGVRLGEGVRAVVDELEEPRAEPLEALEVADLGALGAHAT